jgi:hypothetical protein
MYVDLMGKEKALTPKVIDVTDRFKKTLEEMKIDMESYLREIRPVDVSILVPHGVTRWRIRKMLGVTEEQAALIPDSVLTEFEEDPLKFNYFYTLVRTWGPWDLKAHDYADLKEYDKILYNWKEYRYDDFWNIAYWYAWSALGISEKTLKVMWWYAQLNAWTSKPEWTFEHSYFDDPRDQAMISEWFGLYKF